MSGRLAAWCGLVLAVAAVGYAGRASGAKPAQDALYRYSTAISELVLFGIILGVVALIGRGASWRELFALRRPTSWTLALGIALGVLVTIGIVNAVLEPLLHAGREQGLTPHGWESARAAQFGVNFAVFAVVGPVVEELTFRGLGYSLLEPLGPAAAILALGVAFGVWHGLVEALPVLVAFGVGLAYLRSRTRSVYPGMILHAAFNAIALVVAVAS